MTLKQSDRHHLGGTSLKTIPFPHDFAAYADLHASYRTRLIQGSNLPNPHAHECLEVGFIHKGNGTFFVSGKCLPFKTGDVTIVWDAEPHMACYAAAAACTWLYFDPLRMGVAPPDHPLLHTAGLFSGNGFLNVFSGTDYPLIAETVQDLIREFECKGTWYREAVRGYVLVLLAYLHRLREANDRHFRPGPAGNGQQSAAKILPAVRYMHTHFAEEISIDELAKSIFMSPTNFRRLFRRILGISPYEYLTNYRLSKAAEAMKTSDRGIEEIAFECGFGAISAFRRAFKRLSGKAPARWRKER